MVFGCGFEVIGFEGCVVGVDLLVVGYVGY